MKERVIEMERRRGRMSEVERELYREVERVSD